MRFIILQADLAQEDGDAGVSWCRPAYWLVLNNGRNFHSEISFVGPLRLKEMYLGRTRASGHGT